MQQLRIGIEWHGRIGHIDSNPNLRVAASESFVERAHALHDILRVDAFKLRLRHLAEVRETPNDRLQVRNLRRQRRRALAKYLVELRLRQLARPHQVFDGELQRKERILELVRQPPRQFAPGSYAFALHQAVALALELLRHVIEAARQHAHLVASARRHAHVPISASHFFGCMRQLLDGPRNPRRNPQTECDGKQNAAGRHAISNGANMLLRLDHAAARNRHQQHRHHVALFVFERDRGCVQAVLTPPGRIHNATHLLARRARGVNQVLIMRRADDCSIGSEKACRIEGRQSRRTRSCAQIHCRCQTVRIAVQTDLHPRRHRKVGEKTLIEPLAADQAHFGSAHCVHGEEAESSRAVRQVFTFEEWFGRGICGRGLRITEPRGPLHGADHVSVCTHNLKKIELRVLRHGLRFRQIG